ncbi:MAG: hypothetical protein MJ093_08925 [Saccharofermentans sp.]|nr:hypothetical protein [Saccharofermentans sp.]
MDNENKEIENEEIFSDDEYKKALEALNSSKSVRLKETKKKKEENKKPSNPNGKEAKMDPVIIGCIIGICLVVIGAVLYFTIPKLMVKNIGMSVNDIRAKYEASSVYSNTLAEYGLSIPAVEYDTEAQNGASNVKHFNAIINPQVPEVNLSVAIEGNELNNGMVTEFHIMAQLKTDANSYNFYWILFASYLQVFDEELADDTAFLLASEAMNNISDGKYYELGDVAYRVQLKKLNDSFSYVQIEFVNKDTLTADQISKSTVLESAA